MISTDFWAKEKKYEESIERVDGYQCIIERGVNIGYTRWFGSNSS